MPRVGVSQSLTTSGLKIYDEPDPIERRNAELEQELETLKNRMPILRISFTNGSDREVFKLSPPAELSEEQVARQIADLKQEYPKLQMPSPRKAAPSSRKIILDDRPRSNFSEMIGWNSIPDREIERYNNELEGFYSAFEAYLRKFQEHVNFERRVIGLNLIIVNEGTAPANDIDVILSFPDGLKLYEKKRLPEIPKRPKPPEQPRTWMEMMTASARYMPHNLVPLMSTIAPPRNVSSPRIRNESSYTVEIHVERLKQNLHESFDPLYIVFESFESVTSFCVFYRINAADFPREVNGQIHVIVEKEGQSDVSNAS